MKKYLFISVAALLALAACSKVVPTPVEAVGEHEVSFEVANYAINTKADPVSLAREFDAFHTYAIFHSTDPANPNQWFMEDDEVRAQGENGINKWAPVTQRFWPKTGDISFYSYAGTRRPSLSPEPGREGTMSFGPFVINGLPVPAASENDPTTGAGRVVDVPGEYPVGTTFLPADNILVADPAYKFQKNVNTYNIDPLDKPAGVPTLFHHMLAKVRFQLVLDASDSDSKTTWTLTLPEAQPILTVLGDGTLDVTYSAAPEGFNTTGSLSKVEWTLGQYRQPIWAQPLTLEATASRVPATDENNLIAVPSIKGETPVFEREFVVIPQRFDNLPFHFSGELSNTFDMDGKIVEGITEVITRVGNMGIFIPNYTPNQPQYWLPNHIYTYKITVKTNGEVNFVPAVTDWENDSASHEI